MAFPSTAVIEVRPTGSDLNGGGFNSARGGTDYSQQDAAQATGTVTSSTTTVTATTGIFTSAMVGNYITDGTTWREITAYTSSTVVTVDAAPSWTSASINVGGALASLGRAGALMVTGNTIYVKNGSYTMSSGTANTNNGIFSVSVGSDSALSAVVGYSTSRTINNTTTSPPVFTASGISSVTMIRHTGTFCAFRFRNIVVNGASLSNVQGFGGTSGSSTTFECCTAQNCSTGFGGSTSCVKCFASSCGVGFSGGFSFHGCVANGGTGHGFTVATSAVMSDCIASNKSGASSDGFNLSLSAGGAITNCTAYGNGRHGFNINNYPRGICLLNCISDSNGGWGITINSNAAHPALYNCATRNNTSGGIQQAVTGQEVGSITLSANPFTNAGAGDFSLNNTAGGGAACRAAGYLGAFLSGTTTSYGDVGAAQSQGGGSSVAFPTCGLGGMD